MQSSELELFLSHDLWMRRLAGGLLRDAGEAEDVVQDLWARALEVGASPLACAASGTSPRSPRAWLAGLLRNKRLELGRARARRERHERAAARPEAEAGPDELVEQLSLRKAVAEQLLALDEPFRGALYLRFYQDCELKEVARRQGVPLSTAHARVQRGLELLRARLDREHGGARRAWALSLAQSVRPAGSPALTLELLTMAGAGKVAVALLALGGLTWWWLERGERRGETVPLAAAPLAPDESGPVADARPSAAAVSREAVAPAGAERTAESAANPVGEAALLRGRVIDTHGTPVALVEVALQRPDTSARPPTALTDAAGEFTLAPGASGTDFPLECLDARYRTLVPGARADGERVVVVAPRAGFAGVVVDPAGAPIAGATLSMRMRERLFRELGLVRPGWVTFEGPAATSDERGRFAITGTAGGEGVFLEVDAQGFRPRQVELAPGGASDMVVELAPNPREVTYRGLVLDAEGQPVPDAQVSAGESIVRTDEAGRFALDWHGSNGVTIRDENGVWRQQGIEAASLIALKPGHAPALARLAELDPAETVVLRLGAGLRSIEGTVVDPAGEPLPQILVWIRDPLRFGSRTVTVGDEVGSYSNDLEVEELVCEGPSELAARTGPDGSFHLGGLLARDYQLLAFDPSAATRGGPWSVSAGATDARLVLAPEPGTTRVAGRIVTPGGEPLVGVELEPLRAGQRDRHDQPPGVPGVELSRTTDAQGRFAFEALVAPGTSLQLFHERTFIRFVSLDDFRDLAHLELVLPVLCELQLDLTRVPELADSFHILDGGGAVLELIEASGQVTAMMESPELKGALSNVLRVPETARTLVLLKGGAEVLRRPLALDPLALTTFRP